MSKTIQSKGELYLTENQFNNRDSSGTLEEGVVYNIIDPVGYATEEYVNEQISSNGGTKVTVGGSNVATFDADSKQNKLTASDPIQLSDDGGISLNLGDSLYAASCNGGLVVNWDSIPISSSGPLYFGSCNEGLNILVDSSTFYINSCNGLQINRPNNLLDIGLGDYSTYIYKSCNTLNLLAESLEIDATSGEIRIQATSTYPLIIHNQAYGLVMDSSNNLSIGAIDSCNSSINKSGPYIEIDSSALYLYCGDKTSGHGIKIDNNGVYINGTLINP